MRWDEARESGSFRLCQRVRHEREIWERRRLLLYNNNKNKNESNIFWILISLLILIFPLMAVWLVEYIEREAEDEWWCFIFIKLSQVTILTFLQEHIQVHCQSVHFHKIIWKNKIKVTSSRILIITGFNVTVLRHVFKLKLATVIDAILRMSFGTQHNSQTGSIIWSTQKREAWLNVFRYQFIRFPLYDIILETESLKWSTMEIGHKRFKILSKD